MFGISFPHVLIYLFGIADGWSTFRCIWWEPFNETVTSCKKGWRHVWTSENQASWSTQVSFVCSSWKEEFWYLWLVNTTKSPLTSVVHFIFRCIIMPLTFTGPWKKKCLAEFGIVTQCVAPTRVNDQYLTNVLLKINAKVCSSSPWDLRASPHLYMAIMYFWYFFPFQTAGWHEFIAPNWNIPSNSSSVQGPKYNLGNGRVAWFS